MLLSDPPRGFCGHYIHLLISCIICLINWKNVYVNVLNIIDTYSRKHKRVLARYKPIKNKQKEQQKNILGEAMKNVNSFS
jgi:hypothetical protein